MPIEMFVLNSQNTFVESITSANPVRAVPAAGLTAMLPVIAEVGTVEMPLLETMAKLTADPMSTVAGFRARAEIW